MQVLMHSDGVTGAPLGVWAVGADGWDLTNWYLGQGPAEGRGRVLLGAARSQLTSGEAAAGKAVQRLADVLVAPVGGSDDWSVLELVEGEDPEHRLVVEAKRWFRDRWANPGATCGADGSRDRRRYWFAATEAVGLAGALLDTGDPSVLRVGAAGQAGRLSTRVVPIVDDRAGVVVVAVGAQEPPEGADLALAYSLALRGDRDLWLVLPAGSEWPTLARLPWLDLPVRVWTHQGNDPATLVEHPVLLRSQVRAGHDDDIVTVEASLSEHRRWVEELIRWADTHEALYPAHRKSYLAWHCKGHRVLRLTNTKTCVRVIAGLTSAQPTSPHPVELKVTGPGTDFGDVKAAVTAAIEVVVDGTDTSQLEHRFQARLANSPTALGHLGLAEVRREFPCFRPGPNKPRRAYMDFLGRGLDGALHIVETKVGTDPMITVQCLDYFVWADAHRVRLAGLVGADPTERPKVDLVVLRPQGVAVLDHYTRAVLDALDRQISWRVWVATGDLDGELHIEAMPATRSRANATWADQVGRRVGTAAEYAGDRVRNGWYGDRLDGLAPGAQAAANELADRNALHPYFGHVRSSQRFAVNLFGPLEASGVSRLLERWFGPLAAVDAPVLEWVDPADRLQEATEPHPHTTQVDVLLTGRRSTGEPVAALIEVKLTESGFGRCSHPEVAPEELQQTCLSPGPFGGNQDSCWQLRNHDDGPPRRYADHLSLDSAATSSADCWFRTLNQPMRLAALAHALEDDGDFAEVVVALCAPPGHRVIHRRWADATRLLPGRLVDLDPGEVAALLSPAACVFMTDRYGIVPVSAA